MYKILIAGDVVPTESNCSFFEQGDIDTLFGKDIIHILDNTEYKMFNLECPLTDKQDPIAKSGPNLSASSSSINTIKAIKPSVITLANNHIMDQGNTGLFSTIELLKDSSIPFIGAGKDIDDAQRPFFFSVNNKKVGVFACAEHEFSIATKNKPGANPMDLLDTPDLVHGIKSECDFLIVLYHGGKEYYRYPSPQLQKRCRKIVEKGADLVVCQHSHCIGCMEKVDDATIVYGQGNFIFDGSEDECWKTSLLLALDENFDLDYIPIKKEKNVVRMAKANDAEKILLDFWNRSEEIKIEGTIEQKYYQIASIEIDSYLLGMSGIRMGFVYYALNKLFFHKLTPLIVKCKFKKRALLSIKNHIECEAHSELLLTGIDQKIDLIREGD